MFSEADRESGAAAVEAAVEGRDPAKMEMLCDEKSSSANSSSLLASSPSTFGPDATAKILPTAFCSVSIFLSSFLGIKDRRELELFQCRLTPGLTSACFEMLCLSDGSAASVASAAVTFDTSSADVTEFVDALTSTVAAAGEKFLFQLRRI